MKIVPWLLHLDDLVPLEVTPRRARRARVLALLFLVATFPDIFIDFQTERLRPVIDAVVEQVRDVADGRPAVQQP